MEYIAPKKYRTYFIYQAQMSNRVSCLLDRRIAELREARYEFEELMLLVKVWGASEVDMSSRN